MSQSFIDNEKSNELNHKEQDDEIEDGIQAEEKNANKNELEENEETVKEWVDILGSGAILKKIVQEGQPDTKPERGEKCSITYKCSLEDGTVVEEVENLEVFLGECDVISGLDVALSLMNVQEKCILKIDSRLAYGKKGNPPIIPGNAVVIYDIELVKVAPSDNIEDLTVHERKALGNKKRERGNWWYSRGENNLALQCYRKALDYLDEVEAGNAEDKEKVTDSELQSLLEDRISVYNNMAAAQIKMEMYEPALNSLQVVLGCQPNNVKAHFRKAKVFIGKNDLSTAMKCLLKAKEISPQDQEIQKEIANLKKQLAKQINTEIELARRMLNGPKNLDSKSKVNSKKQMLNVWTTSVGALLALGMAGFMAYRLKYF